MQNPYAAPGTGYGNPFASVAQSDYVPLGWRTTMAGLAIASTPVFHVLVTLVLMTSAKDGDDDDGSVLVALVQLFCGLGLILSFVAGVVFFGIWLHRAVRNLRGLGRTGMVFTPAGAVASFYIPFVNWVRPHRALTELWRASDPAPECAEGGWTAYGTTTALVSVWWGFWLAWEFLENISGRIDDPKISGALGFAASAVMAVAAVTCIQMMRGVVARQEAAAARLAIARAAGAMRGL
jgi:Domain of unknown function (DUF4328)